MSTINPLRVQQKKKCLKENAMTTYLYIRLRKHKGFIFITYFYVLFISAKFLYFRYSPMSYPTVMKFSVEGVTLMENMYNCNKVTCTINLDNLGQKSSGAYR